jgi:hypothetical protein
MTQNLLFLYRYEHIILNIFSQLTEIMRDGWSPKTHRQNWTDGSKQDFLLVRFVWSTDASKECREQRTDEKHGEQYLFFILYTIQILVVLLDPNARKETRLDTSRSSASIISRSIISSSTLNEHEISRNHDSNSIDLIADIRHSIEMCISNQAIASIVS